MARANARVYCEMSETCQSGLAALTYGSLQTCIERSTLHWESIYSSDGLLFDAKRIQICVDAQRAQNCDDWLAALTPGCGGGGGTLKLGQACIYGSQCASAFCDFPPDRSGLCGVCAEIPREGARCNRCAYSTGLSCVAETDGGEAHCVRPRAEGESCDPVFCEPQLFCSWPREAGLPRFCRRATAQLGEFCDTVVGPHCDSATGVSCDAVAHVCVVPAPALEGEACGQLARGVMTDCKAGTCVVPPESQPTTLGTCQSAIPDGSPCQPGAVACLPPALCIDGSCQVPRGELCI